MAKAVGIGGVFLQFKGDEKDLLDWYHHNLNIDMSKYGAGFIEGEQLVLLTFKTLNENNPLLNLRVDNIDTLFITFKELGLKIISEVKEYDYGKFGQFMDPFENIIELWEPYKDAYKNMVKEEIKAYKKGKL